MSSESFFEIFQINFSFVIIYYCERLKTFNAIDYLYFDEWLFGFIVIFTLNFCYYFKSNKIKKKYRVIKQMILIMK